MHCEDELLDCVRTVDAEARCKADASSSTVPRHLVTAEQPVHRCGMGGCQQRLAGRRKTDQRQLLACLVLQTQAERDAAIAIEDIPGVIQKEITAEQRLAECCKRGQGRMSAIAGGCRCGRKHDAGQQHQTYHKEDELAN